VGYTDADWATDKIHRRSRTGYLFMVGSGCVSWRSTLQKTVALSTVEAEYMAIAAGMQEGIWLATVINEIGLDNVLPISMKGDNQGSIALCKNPGNHNRTKHIDIRHHFIRERVRDNWFDLKYCRTEDMLADIFTKALPGPRFAEICEKIGVVCLRHGEVLEMSHNTASLGLTSGDLIKAYGGFNGSPRRSTVSN